MYSASSLAADESPPMPTFSATSVPDGAVRRLSGAGHAGSPGLPLVRPQLRGGVGVGAAAGADSTPGRTDTRRASRSRSRSRSTERHSSLRHRSPSSPADTNSSGGSGRARSPPWRPTCRASASSDDHVQRPSARARRLEYAEKMLVRATPLANKERVDAAGTSIPPVLGSGTLEPAHDNA
eukprot:SAG31_NODE_18595_length_630_cov_0.960452_1_plen_180_part_10